MPNFFVEDLSETTVITGDDARHISRSLRMQPGERLTLCDNSGRQAEGVIACLSGDAVTVRLGEVSLSLSEPSTALTLFLCLPKGDKADLVVQKSAELGVGEVVLVLSERCVSRPNAADGAKKVTRLQKIAREASMQSGRARIVSVQGILSFQQAINKMSKYDAAFLLYEGNCTPLRHQLPEKGSRIALMTGSEGGFSPAEVDLSAAAGILPVSLGRRILRCETAPLAALAALMFSLGEME
jgi:16S rRNA (uracil1498-N3)-methyltransferase